MSHTRKWKRKVVVAASVWAVICQTNQAQFVKENQKWQICHYGEVSFSRWPDVREVVREKPTWTNTLPLWPWTSHPLPRIPVTWRPPTAHSSLQLTFKKVRLACAHSFFYLRFFSPYTAEFFIFFIPWRPNKHTCQHIHIVKNQFCYPCCSICLKEAPCYHPSSISPKCEVALSQWLPLFRPLLLNNAAFRYFFPQAEILPRLSMENWKDVNSLCSIRWNGTGSSYDSWT